MARNKPISISELKKVMVQINEINQSCKRTILTTFSEYANNYDDILYEIIQSKLDKKFTPNELSDVVTSLFDKHYDFIVKDIKSFTCALNAITKQSYDHQVIGRKIKLYGVFANNPSTELISVLPYEYANKDLDMLKSLLEYSDAKVLESKIDRITYLKVTKASASMISSLVDIVFVKYNTSTSVKDDMLYIHVPKIEIPGKISFANNKRLEEELKKIIASTYNPDDY